MTAGERARGEIRRAAARAVEAERDLEALAEEMLALDVSPDLACQEAVTETSRRLRVLAESLQR